MWSEDGEEQSEDDGDTDGGAQRGPEIQGSTSNMTAGTVYQELRTWMQSDGLKLHNSLLI